jgi:hypothetical protein
MHSHMKVNLALWKINFFLFLTNYIYIYILIFIYAGALWSFWKARSGVMFDKDKKVLAFQMALVYKTLTLFKTWRSSWSRSWNLWRKTWLTWFQLEPLCRFRSCLDSKSFLFWYCSTFVFIWQTLSNHRVTRLKRFVLRFPGKLCN